METEEQNLDEWSNRRMSSEHSQCGPCGRCWWISRHWVAPCLIERWKYALPWYRPKGSGTGSRKSAMSMFLPGCVCCDPYYIVFIFVYLPYKFFGAVSVKRISEYTSHLPRFETLHSVKHDQEEASCDTLSLLFKCISFKLTCHTALPKMKLTYLKTTTQFLI